MPLLLGIDLGGTKLALALGDERGRVRERLRRPTDPSGDPQRDVARLLDDARALLARAGVTPADVAHVGLSVPGPMDPERGVLLDPPNLDGWGGELPVRDWVAAGLGVPAAIENDANAAALAEWRFGAGRGYRHVVYLTMSTGIGGGIVADGRLYRGLAWNAGEIGHAPVEWDGEPCACGMRGCLEAYAGGAAWTRRLRALTPATSAVARLAGGRERARPEHVVEAAREGDAFARAELDRFNDYVARALAALAFVLAPEIAILGTIPSRAGEALCLEPIRARVRAHVWPVLARGMRIEPSGLGDALPDYAGLCVALAAVESDP